jgi:hypothetical protein
LQGQIIISDQGSHLSMFKAPEAIYVNLSGEDQSVISAILEETPLSPRMVILAEPRIYHYYYFYEELLKRGERINEIKAVFSNDLMCVSQKKE